MIKSELFFRKYKQLKMQRFGENEKKRSEKTRSEENFINQEENSSARDSLKITTGEEKYKHIWTIE